MYLGAICWVNLRCLFHPKPHLIQRSGQLPHAAVRVVQLVKAKQPDAEGHEVSRLIALQGHTSGSLQAQRPELFAAL